VEVEDTEPENWTSNLAVAGKIGDSSFFGIGMGGMW